MTEHLVHWLDVIGGHEASQRALATGQYLFCQGDTAEAVYVVRRGRVGLRRHLVDGTAVSVHTARAGESFAEAALFSTVYHCDAVALAPSEVRVFPKAALLAAMARAPEMGLALSAALARQVQSLRGRLQLRTLRSARDRVLQAVRLATPAGGPLVFDRPLKEVAGELGLTHEAFYRALAVLQRDGLILRQGRTVTLTALATDGQSLTKTSA